VSRAVGARAERLAGAHLEALGFKILEYNYFCHGGEIDLVCEHEDTLVFVEVRARADGEHGHPFETISPLKRQRLVRAARHYLMERDGEDRACRFDVVGIEGETVTHLANAFRTDGAD